MNTNKLQDFVTMCAAIGSLPDYVQGGGGNTSVKLDNIRMAVKASGYKIRQITTTDGYVVVDYESIARYHKTADSSHKGDLEKEANDFVQSRILKVEGLKTLRPSVEAGFHSILKTFVIHTHPVYANILTCCKGGEALAREILKDSPYPFIWLPYINPGFALTLAMNREIEIYQAKHGVFPPVIFMQNHGLVTTDHSARECEKMHKEVNRTIARYFGIKDAYPVIQMEEAEEDVYTSKEPLLLNFFQNRTGEVFDQWILYPDQLVYLNSSYREGKISINKDNITFHTGKAEALTILETLIGYVFVIDQIQKSGKEIQTLGQAGVDFINNWESEKYRKNVAKGN